MYVSLAGRGTTWTLRIAEALAATGIANLFNPSVLQLGQSAWVAFRGVYPGDETPFRAFVLSIDTQAGQSDDRPPLLVDLTAAFKPYVASPISDPKLFSISGEPWVTFNTGHFEKPNSIYVASLRPQIGAPLRIEIAERQTIEKNWGFFEKDGQLCALYSLDPLVILSEKERTGDAIFMGAHLTDFTKAKTKRPALTIGTQPLVIDEERATLALIAHRRHYLRGKRIYTGRPVTVDLAKAHADVGSFPWFHSLRALRGHRIRHNPNLLSCTYFAGLSRHRDDFVVSYGINDVDFAIAEMPRSAWPNLRYNGIRGRRN